MIGNAISYDSALKNGHNFCSAGRIFNLFFDFSNFHGSCVYSIIKFLERDANAGILPTLWIYVCDSYNKLFCLF